MVQILEEWGNSLIIVFLKKKKRWAAGIERISLLLPKELELNFPPNIVIVSIQNKEDIQEVNFILIY